MSSFKEFLVKTAAADPSGHPNAPEIQNLATAADWLLRNEINRTPGLGMDINGEEILFEDIMNDLKLSFDKSAQRVQAAVVKILRLYDAQEKTAYLAKVISEPSSSDTEVAPELLVNWLRAMTGIREPGEAHKNAIKHFIWQVKRKIKGLDVIHHLMINFLGPQGTGKTYSIERLYAPIANYVSTGLTVDDLTDQKFAKSLKNNYIVFLDELARASNKEAAHFKSLMTRKVNDQRVLFSTNFDRLKHNATFISATNVSLREILPDATGQRRFYEMDCLGKHNAEISLQERHAFLPADMSPLWRAIPFSDASAPYYKASVEEFEQKQEELRTESMFEEWFAAVGIKRGSTYEAAGTVMFEDYLEFKRARDYHEKMDLKAFYKRLETDPAVLIRKSNKNQAWFIFDVLDEGSKPFQKKLVKHLPNVAESVLIPASNRKV